MTDDARRALDDYGAMVDEYAADADDEPVKSAYDRPAILRMAGDIDGKRVLEAGCATGALTKSLVGRGAAVVGIDIEPRLVALAEARLAGSATFHTADLSSPMPFLEDDSFDVVVASLVLHYIRDWSTPLGEFRRVLRRGGALLVSTHHPMQDIEIERPPADYFSTVLLTDTWTVGGRTFPVRFYHRPLSAIVDALADAGFLIERIPEPLPDPEAFAEKQALFERMARSPWFLFMRAVKPR